MIAWTLLIVLAIDHWIMTVRISNTYVNLLLLTHVYFVSVAHATTVKRGRCILCQYMLTYEPESMSKGRNTSHSHKPQVDVHRISFSLLGAGPTREVDVGLDADCVVGGCVVPTHVCSKRVAVRNVERAHAANDHHLLHGECHGHRTLHHKRPVQVLCGALDVVVMRQVDRRGRGHGAPDPVPLPDLRGGRSAVFVRGTIAHLSIRNARNTMAQG